MPRMAQRPSRDKSLPGSCRPVGAGQPSQRFETMEEFYRIRRLPPYVFEEVNRAKARARNAGADIIDLGMGNPDLPTPAHVVEKLSETLGKPRTDRYSASRGIPGLRRAQAAYYERRFGVKLDPETQVVTTLGSKEGFANVAQAITAPGDVVLVPEPELSDPRLRLPDGGRRHPLGAVGADAEFLPHAGTRHHPLDPEADRAGGLLSVQSDGLGGEPRFLQGPRRLRQEARDLGAVRSRLCGGLFRRQPAAVDPAGAGRDGYRRRIHLDVEDLFDAGLAHRLRRRQRAADRGARPRQVLSRLRRLHADPGGGDRGAQRPGRLHRGNARDLQAPPRRAGGELRPRRLARAVAARLDVRLGADPGAVQERSAASSSPRFWWRRPMSRSRPASASANMARASCASRWWRTSSASARRRATSAAS